MIKLITKIKETTMSINDWFKKLLGYVTVPLVVTSIFYGGIMWNKTANSEKDIKNLQTDTVTKELWKQTDKKIDTVILSNKTIEEKLDGIAQNNSDDHNSIKDDLNETKIEIAVLDQRVVSLEKDHSDTNDKAVSYYMPDKFKKIMEDLK
jgi:hypothetical protein